MKIITTIQNSAAEMKNVKTLTTCGVLVAISIILGYCTIQIGDFLKIGFTSIPNEVSAYLFGPIPAAILGAVTDLLNFVIKPTGPYFPGFTISGIVIGIISGLMFYQKPFSLKRVVLTCLMIMLIVDTGLNTLWLSMLYGKSMVALLPIRFVKNLILWPIQSGLLYMIMKAMQKAGVMSLMRKKAH